MSVSDLEALLAVQDLDLAADRDRHRRATLPERTRLADVDARVAELERLRADVVLPRDDIATRQDQVEAELAAAEERAAAVSKRLYGGEVSASRELQAMASDVDALKARSSQLEDRVLELMEEREPLDRRVADLDGEIESLREQRGAVVEALAGAESAVDAELAGLTAERERSAEAVPADLLATYDRLRSRLGGIGAARLVGDHCDGCHLTLPATELDRIRHLPAGELVTCDQCGRILVPA
jgi:uncharacterized protein